MWLAFTGGCALAGTARIPAGIVLLGEDGPGHPGTPTHVPAFRIDTTEVTNREFQQFVQATGYITTAEREGQSAVFIAPARLDGGLEDLSQWWHMVKGACWRHPEGPGSSLEDRWSYPVVQVTYADAQAYARWRGGALPTEIQWERAARGNQRGPRDPLSWARDARGKWRVNAWQGTFPLRDTAADGHRGLAPAGSFPPNEFGLYDIIGNAWEWTQGAGNTAAIRGGSFLCAAEYCANFRPAGRQLQEMDLGTSHIGLRVAYPDRPAGSK